MTEKEDKKSKKKHRSRSRSRSRDKDKKSRNRSRSREKSHRSRSRSRSRQRDKDRGRDRERERERERERDRDRDKPKDRERDRSKRHSERSPSKDRKRKPTDDEETKKDRERVDSSAAKEDKVNSILNTSQDDGLSSSSGLSQSTTTTTQITDDEREKQRQLEQEQLDEEMRKRRERVKAWQEAKAAQNNTTTTTTTAVSQSNTPVVESKQVPLDTIVNINIESDISQNETGTGAETGAKSVAVAPGWSLEDDDEDESKEEALADVTEQTNPSNALEVLLKLPPPSPKHPVQPEINILASSPLKTIPSPFAGRFDVKKSASPSVVAPQAQQPSIDDDDIDPLDAFMNELNNATGDEAPAAQVELKSSATPKNMSSSDLSFDNFLDMDVGSNFITLDQIIQMRVNPLTESQSKKSKQSGWETDSQCETEEQQEEREEAERREFIEALRKAREDEAIQAEKTAKKDEAQSKAEAEFGRVFADEGDVLDEAEIEEKKKSALELLEEQKRGKELRPVDHSAIEYLPFRKNLYIVPRVLAKLSESEVAAKREELQVKVRGRNCPAPVDNWDQCGLSDRILQVIEKLKFEAPFAIQKQTIPAIMAGRDIIAVAKTGSGKTLAFLLPMFRHILDQPRLREGEGPIGLIMAPARELAFQINNEAKKFSKALGLRVACIYGGASVADQIADLKRGADIVVCTPGRMIDILCMQAGKMVTMKRVTMVVMDEADRMFDMGFEPQIKMILQNIRPDKQVILFSATFPKQIEKLARSVLKLPLEIIVGERSTVNKDIKQIVEVHEEPDKFMRLLQLLGVWYEKGSVLIFVDKQDKCDQLFSDLLKSGYPCLSLHGGKDQLDRDHTLHEFKTLIKTVMVATSVAGRGLDVPEIVCVINYNCPNHLEDYVHRVGRTGRAGRKGTAYTFISSGEEQYANIMVKALSKAGEEIPKELRELEDSFKAKVESGEAKWAAYGFEGKGFTFDADEMNESQKLVSMQRKLYNIEQGIEDDEAAEYADEDGEYVPEDDTPGDSTAADKSKQPTAAATSSSSSLLYGTSQPNAPGAPGTKVSAQEALAKALSLAHKLSGKSGGSQEASMHFADEIEINDYPPQVRRKVTNRVNLDQITDMTGANIIMRGSYIMPGKKLEPGERKLHILIEGTTDLQVKQSKLELCRQLEEETIKLGASSATSAIARFSVL